MNEKISDIDIAAYEIYTNDFGYKYNNSTVFLPLNINNFVTSHRKFNNCTKYYNKALIKSRKIKLIKIYDTQNN